jgi:hypothetical protein
MVRDYRAWLQSELQLLGNASHHAYSLGQANMAKRAIERLDAEIDDRIVLELEPESATAIADALDMMAEAEALPDALVELLQLIRTDQQ